MKYKLSLHSYQPTGCPTKFRWCCRNEPIRHRSGTRHKPLLTSYAIDRFWPKADIIIFR